MLRYSRSLTAAMVTGMVLVVLLVVAVNGSPMPLGDSDLSIDTYNHEGEVKSPQPAVPHWTYTRPPLNIHDFESLYEGYRNTGSLTSVLLDPIFTKTQGLWRDIDNVFDTWFKSVRAHGQLWVIPDDVGTSYDRLLVKTFVDNYHAKRQKAAERREWNHTAIVGLLADLTVLLGTKERSSARCPFKDLPGTTPRLGRIIVAVESIVNIQMDWVYFVAVNFLQFLLEYDVAASNYESFMFHFIRTFMMGGMSISDDSIEDLVREFIEQWLKPERDAAGKVLKYSIIADPPSDETFKERFNTAIYSRVLEQCMEVSRNTIDDRIRYIKNTLVRNRTALLVV